MPCFARPYTSSPISAAARMLTSAGTILLCFTPRSVVGDPRALGNAGADSVRGVADRQRKPLFGPAVFALPPLARAAVGLLLALAVFAVVLLVGNKATSPARFHREVSRICAAVGAQNSPPGRRSTALPRCSHAILARSSATRSAYFTLNQKLSALGAPAAQATVWHTFLGELDRAQATLQTMASAALAGAAGQLRALEATRDRGDQRAFRLCERRRLGLRERLNAAAPGSDRRGYDLGPPGGISSSVERELPKLERRVRFPYPASRNLHDPSIRLASSDRVNRFGHQSSKHG